MRAYTALAAATALFSTAYAATVSLEETPCIQNNTDLEAFIIEVGGTVPKDLDTVCGLKVVSASDADVNAINCQAFKDREASSPGSSVFNIKSPALISTNPVQIRSIKCVVGDFPAPSGTTLVPVISTGTGSPSPSGGNTTVIMTASPTAQPTGPTSTQSGAPNSTGGAVATGVSFAGSLMAAGFAVLML